MLRLISWERISSTQQRRGGSGTVAIAIAAVGVLMALTPATAYAQVQTLSCGNFTDQLYSFPGLMFDVVAKVPIQITGLSHTLAHPAGSSVAYEVYTKPDSFLGFQDSEDDWVQIGAGTVTSQGPTARTVFPIGTTSLPLMNTGARRAFYVTATAGRSIYQGRTGGSIDDLPDTVAAQNAHLWISESVSKSFRFAGTSYPRIWSGTISYNL
ncbi:MAG: hypothetical protein FWD57_10550, partial [Polyangiaceae bacterium]|nr:hypothetical protein [Polyangiaceae bacterium]